MNISTLHHLLELNEYFARSSLQLMSCYHFEQGKVSTVETKIVRAVIYIQSNCYEESELTCGVRTGVSSLVDRVVMLVVVLLLL